MLGLDSILFFLFVFSTLTLFRLLVLTVFSIFSDNPKNLQLKTNELLFYGIVVSYIITYLIKLI